MKSIIPFILVWTAIIGFFAFWIVVGGYLIRAWF